MTNEEKNKKVCLILGIHWHELDKKLQRCKCGVKGPSANPDFYTDADAGAMQLLRELEKTRMFRVFMNDNEFSIQTFISCITTPGLLVDKLIEWKEGKQNG